MRRDESGQRQNFLPNRLPMVYVSATSPSYQKIPADGRSPDLRPEAKATRVGFFE